MRRHLIVLVLLILVFYSCSNYTSEQKAILERGSEVYITHCVSCHGTSGDGLQGAYPTLIKPEIAKANTARAIKLIREGSGFEGGMKPISLTDQEVIEVVNYIQNTWGNKAEFIAEISTQ
ncbi:MAG: cytochrome c [Cyclobacteriaceae bacterium]